ncbi:MAG TPA: hypothetical protein VJA25_01775 [Dehalococcoidia bacterium]|nr:hypothetical protein [Dehalococcoidia bacterium]
MNEHWHLAPVPPKMWRLFTALKPVESVEMLTRSDLLYINPDGYDGVNLFDELMGLGMTYPVALHCVDCQKIQNFEATPEEDSGQLDDCFQLERLDERMKPWLQEHLGCRYQLALPL